jgi:hypothetical protein
MAIEKTIILNADTKGAVKGVNDLEKSIDGVNKEIKQTSGNTSEMTSQLDKFSGGAVSGFKSVIGVLKGVTTGFKSMRIAIISTGIGALIIGIASLTAAFKGSEEGQNKFNKILSIVGALTGNLVDLLADLGEGIINAFTNPIETIKEFANIITTFVFDKIKGTTDGLLLMGSAISKVFSGDFKGALEDTKEGFKALVDNSPYGIIRDGIKGATNSLKEFTVEQIREGKAAASVADMRAKADKIERDLIVNRSKLESEIALLRLKSRQEDEFTAEERKQALLDAQKLEDSLLDKETEYLELRRDAQIQENTFSRSNKENLTKEAEAIAAVNRQVAARANTARQVQREVNTISKQIEAVNKAIAAEEKATQDKKIADEKVRTDAISKIQDEFVQKQKDKEAETELEKINLEEERKLAELDRLDASELQKQEILNYYNGLRVDNKKATDKAETDLDDAKKEAFLGNLGAVSGALNGLSALAGENAEAQKGIGIAQAVIDTYVGATKALAQGGIAGPIAAAGVIASGLASVVTIASTKIPKPKGSSIGGTSRTSIPSKSSTPTPPSFNLAGASETSALSDAVASSTNEPVQAFVVANDVTTAQSLQNNIVEGSTI